GDAKAAEADAERAKRSQGELGIDYFLSARDIGSGAAHNAKEAIKQLQMALLVEPTHEWSLEFLSRYLLAEGRKDEACLAMKGLIAVSPETTEAFEYQLAILFDKKQFDEALALANKAIELDPHRHSYYAHRGRL